jgi:hypothetical protein
MSFDLDSVIKVTNELKEARERVAQLENKLRNIVADRGAMVPLSSLAGNASTPEKLVNLLNANPDRTFDFSDIFKELGGTEAYMRSVIARMVKEKRIESRGWGKYGAKKEDSFGTIKEKLKAV